jgi:hypothetical protein
VASVDDQVRAFKRALAANLLVLRVEAGVGSQKAVAALIPTSEATYRRWENPDDPHLPDAWQVNRLCEILSCEPTDLIRPEPLSEREVQLARRATRAARAGVDQARAAD